MKDSPPQDCSEINSLIDEHINHVAVRIRELKVLQKQLVDLRSSCSGSGSVNECGVLTGMAKRTIEGARTISVATPEELDKLIEWVNAGVTTTPLQVEGEHLFAVERLVVSPAAGVFTPVGDMTEGHSINVGTILGNVGDTEVRSPFAGVLQAYIAVEGERVTPRQPIAWLRAH